MCVCGGGGGWGGRLCFLFRAFPRYLYLFLVCYFCYINGFLASFVRIRTVKVFVTHKDKTSAFMFVAFDYCIYPKYWDRLT